MRLGYSVSSLVINHKWYGKELQILRIPVKLDIIMICILVLVLYFLTLTVVGITSFGCQIRRTLTTVIQKTNIRVYGIWAWQWYILHNALHNSYQVENNSLENVTNERYGAHWWRNTACKTCRDKRGMRDKSCAFVNEFTVWDYHGT